MNKEEKSQDAEFHEAVSAESQEEAIHADTLNDNAVTNSEKKHLIINKETGKVIDAKTGEELTDIQVVTKDGTLGSISASGRIILCGANAYEKKYYFNKEFDKIPDSIKEELHIICVLFTEEVGGIFTISFDESGDVVLSTTADEEDILYDEISGGLLVKEIQRKRQALFEELKLFYRVFVKHEKLEELIEEE